MNIDLKNILYIFPLEKASTAFDVLKIHLELWYWYGLLYIENIFVEQKHLNINLNESL